jgi:hypothetical protein
VPTADEPEEHEEHAELVVHTERSLQRPPSLVVAPNGHAPFRPEVRGALGPLIDELHDLFAQDRAIASQGGNARCGICYLHHPLGELDYHEAEGFYVCSTCQQALGHATINMVRRQQR